MKTPLLILLVAIGCMSALYRRFKRVLNESGDAHGTTEEQSFGGMEFETEPEEKGGLCFEEPVAQQPQYFTYEAPDIQVPKAKPAVASVSVEDRPQQKSFDIRQAIIYQTILNNPYIQERNQ